MADSESGRTVPKKVWDKETDKWVFVGDEWQTLGYVASQSGFDGDMPTHFEEKWLVEHVSKAAWAIVTIIYIPAVDHATDAEIRAISATSAVEWLFDADIECPPQLLPVMQDRSFVPKIISDDCPASIQVPSSSNVEKSKMSSAEVISSAVEITRATEFTARNKLAIAIGCSPNNKGLVKFWKRYATKQPTKKTMFAPEVAMNDDPLPKLIAQEELEQLTKAQAADKRAEGKPRRQRL